ncbi:hypothetical protein AB0C51_01885 [Streptomyces pathocidini]|uniref:Beta-ketoacyl-[acyl-carrier-protein] synthase III N-terminal domain-containing protein n=1 Tax=Streptomyces pathocidini TaxID=1650571 RepID=A0ABW7UNS5_9ACTN|nr:hypothetical protein [Streptomyces pathocidini]
MTTVITAAALATPPAHDPDPSPVRLAARAARDCTAAAGVSPDSIGVLVNVGVYRESNLFEPAMAAMVQKAAGINLDYLVRPAPAAGFSFDLMNGACGVLGAVHVAQCLLHTGTTDRVLITAADVHPCGDATRDAAYPYADLGAALLLERSAEPGAGFGRVRQRNANGRAGTAGYLDTAAMGREGRSRITVTRDADWGVRLVDLATGLVTDHAREEGLDLDRTLVVTSRAAPGFREQLAERLGLDPAAVLAPESPGGPGEPHTAAPVLGYLRAVGADGGLPDAYDRLLFVSVGAGLSGACAVYRPQGR